MKQFILSEDLKLDLQAFFKNFKVSLQDIVPFASLASQLETLKPIEEVKQNEQAKTDKK